jgi:hypothetical protein
LHEEKIMNILSKMGVMDTAEKIDHYINGKYLSSPVTGEMIMSAASAYSVDARLMMAMIEQDSSFATAGKAVRTLNPGNVGNDDSGNLRTYESWQEGVTAVAAWLSRHRGSTIISEIPEETVFESAATSTPPTITPMATSTPIITTSTTTTITNIPITTTSAPESVPIVTSTTTTSTPSAATSTPSMATSTPPLAETPETIPVITYTTTTSTPITTTTTPEAATPTSSQPSPEATAGEAEPVVESEPIIIPPVSEPAPATEPQIQ